MLHCVSNMSVVYISHRTVTVALLRLTRQSHFEEEMVVSLLLQVDPSRIDPTLLRCARFLQKVDLQHWNLYNLPAMMYIEYLIVTPASCSQTIGFESSTQKYISLDPKGTLMTKKILVGFLVFSLLTVMLAACSIYDEASKPAGPEAHMAGASFLVSSVNIKKGDTLTLVDDASAQHIITNGTWDGNTPKPGTESGAPTVNVTLNGNDSATIGPFNTAGTFKLYCTIHLGMNLTVNVQ